MRMDTLSYHFFIAHPILNTSQIVAYDHASFPHANISSQHQTIQSNSTNKVQKLTEYLFSIDGAQTKMLKLLVKVLQLANQLFPGGYIPLFRRWWVVRIAITHAVRMSCALNLIVIQNTGYNFWIEQALDLHNQCLVQIYNKIKYHASVFVKIEVLQLLLVLLFRIKFDVFFNITVLFQ